MRVKIAILASLLPSCASVLHYDTSEVWGTSSGYNSGLFSDKATGYCMGPYEHGYWNNPYDPQTDYAFYFGTDCWLSNGNPWVTFGDFMGGVTNGAYFLYMVLVLKKQVGYSPYFRDLAAFFFWEWNSLFLGFVMHIMAYMGTQYEKWDDIPGWIFFFGKLCNGLQFYGTALAGIAMFAVCLRLLIEPCCKSKQCEDYMWGTIHAVLALFVLITNLLGQFYLGSSYFPMSYYPPFWDLGKIGLFLYAFGRSDTWAIISFLLIPGSQFQFLDPLMKVGMLLLPANLNFEFFWDSRQVLSDFVFFYWAVKLLQNRSFGKGSNSYPLLM